MNLVDLKVFRKPLGEPNLSNRAFLLHKSQHIFCLSSFKTILFLFQN